MRFALGLVLVGLSLLPMARSQAQQASDATKPKLVALVVGISDYAEPALRLPHAARDARDVGQALSAQAGNLYGRADVRVITDGSATRAAIESGLKWLRGEVRKPDTGLVYLVGRAVADNDFHYWFLPADGRPDAIDTDGVPQYDLRRTLASLTGTAVIVLDTPQADTAEARHRRCCTLDMGTVAAAFASGDDGVTALAACRGRETADDGGAGPNGVFTTAFLEGLAHAAGGRRPATITLSRLAALVAEQVSQATRGRQHPILMRPPAMPDPPFAAIEH